MRSRLRLLPAAWLLLLVALPAIAYLLGVRQPLLQNRAAAPFPAVNRSSLPNKATYPRFDAAILDRLPLRQYALQFRGDVAVKVFGHSPSEQVILGKHGVQFYREELRACTDAPPYITDPADAVDLVARSIPASGRTGGMVLAGSKFVADRDDAPSDLAKTVDCVAKLEATVEARLATAPGGIRLQAAFADLTRSGHELFMPKDTHWSGTARLAFDRAVLDAIRPGYAAAAGLALSTKKIRTVDDLGTLLGVTEHSKIFVPQVARTPADAPKPGAVALIGDSQFEHAFQVRAPNGATVQDRALPGQKSCTVNSLGTGACDDLMRGSSSVVQEIVGRNLLDFTLACKNTVQVLGEDMSGPAGRWIVGPEGRGSHGTIKLGAKGANVKATLPGGDVSPTPRLIRIPVMKLPPPSPGQAPPAGQPAGSVILGETTQTGDPITACTSEGQAVQGRVLIVTVPAGRPVSDLKIALLGPIGTVLGRPQEILLDGHDASR